MERSAQDTQLFLGDVQQHEEVIKSFKDKLKALQD